MSGQSGNPFEEGQAAALAGKSWKKGPYAATDKRWTRWNCGYQSALDEKRRQAAQVQAQAVEAKA